MLILIYSLPFIIAVLLLIFFRKQVTWFEYIGLIVLSILFTLMFKSIFISINESDTEYWGSYMTKIRHYDDWDEWVHRTCTRQVLKGYDKDGKPEYEEEEYDYIDVEMSDGQTVALFIIILLLDIGLSIFLIGNEFINENIYKSDGNFKWSLSIEDYERLLEKINDKLTPLVDTFKKIRYYV